MDHVDFASKMDMFLLKDSTSISTSTLREKLPNYTQPKQTKIPLIKPNKSNKKQKQNPMVSFRKINVSSKLADESVSQLSHLSLTCDLSVK